MARAPLDRLENRQAQQARLHDDGKAGTIAAMLRFLKIIGWIALSIVALVFAGITALIWSADTGTASRPRLSQAETDIAVAQRACRDMIGRQLHDPDSAQWGNVRLWPAGRQSDNQDRILVQPEIRARNAMGGMILTRFQCTFEGSGENMRFVDLREY